MNLINQIIIKLRLSPVIHNEGQLIRAIAEIIIIAYVLYRVIKWVKETRAWSLFKGLFVIFTVYALAVALQFNTITWVISNTLNVGIIALIIIFQPEMRKALEQLGKGKIVTGVFSPNIENSGAELTLKSINEIAQAAAELSRARTGALIVIQKKVGVADFEAQGIPMDAVISKQLLINIFEDKTPLHDGAVIIKDNRISSAKCILPLTAQDIDAALGTRHKAAVGASENSDALVIVVSEETGSVSAAREGKLSRNLNEKELLRILSGDKPAAKSKMTMWKELTHVAGKNARKDKERARR